jgi:hypothetical protein
MSAPDNATPPAPIFAADPVASRRTPDAGNGLQTSSGAASAANPAPSLADDFALLLLATTKKDTRMISWCTNNAARILAALRAVEVLRGAKKYIMVEWTQDDRDLLQAHGPFDLIESARFAQQFEDKNYVHTTVLELQAPLEGEK